MESTARLPAASAARQQRDERLAALLGTAARGDARAFEAFYDATAGHARAVARRILQGADLEDLLADAYFEAWRSAARFDPARGSAVTWLLTLVRSRALDRWRAQTSRRDAEGQSAADDGEGTTGDPADRLWQQQSGSRLDEALRSLGSTERWLLGLAYWRELSHGQIAAATGLPLGTVKTTLQRAQARLRSAWAEESR